MVLRERKKMADREREIERLKEEQSTKLSSDKLITKHTRWEEEEGQLRINGCALIDKLIKQTNTSTCSHIKTRTECKADAHLNNPKRTQTSRD